MPHDDGPAASAGAKAPSLAGPELLVLGGAFNFSVMLLCSKLVSRRFVISPWTIIALRNAFGLIFSTAFMVTEWCCALAAGTQADSPCDFPKAPRTWAWLVLRCFGGFACTILEFVALQALPLGEATIIVYTVPVWVMFWAVLLLGEPVKPSTVLCSLACFGGLFLIVQPWSQNQDGPPWAYGAALASAVFGGLVYVSLRQLKDVHFQVVLNCFMTTSLALSVLTGGVLGQLSMPPFNSQAWLWISILALSAYMAEICITVGFAHARSHVGRVAVLKYTTPIFSLFWGVLCFGEVMGALEIAGSSVVFVASAVIFYQSAETQSPEEQSILPASQPCPAAEQG